jgi:hypothetical protein
LEEKPPYSILGTYWSSFMDGMRGKFGKFTVSNPFWLQKYAKNIKFAIKYSVIHFLKYHFGIPKI